MQITGVPSGVSFAVAGLGLFLLAIKLMSNSLKTMSGGFTTKLLKRFAKNRWLALSFGIVFTTMIQSFDGAVALTIGLIAAGFMTLGGAIPFILGANIGTATTSIIVYLGDYHFTQYFTILCFIGGLGYLLVKEEKKSNIAMLIFSFGAIFLGLKVLSAGMHAVSDTSQFKSIVHGAAFNPWVALTSSLGLTGVMQSSSATITVVQGLYGGGGNAPSMSLASGIAMIIGANIGTTFTGLIASIGSPKETKRIAVVWLITNLLMAIVVMPAISQYGNLIDKMVYGGSDSSRRLQLSVAHLLFNGTLVAIFIWLVKPLEYFSRLIIKDERGKVAYQLNIPDQLIYESPALAFESAAKSSEEIAKMTRDASRLARDYIRTNSKASLRYFNELNSLIEVYKRSLYAYLVKLGSVEITKSLSSKHMSLVLATRSLDKISSLIKTVLGDLHNSKSVLTKHEIDEIESLMTMVHSQIKRLPNLLTRWSSKTAKEVKLLEKLLEESTDKYEKEFIIRNKKQKITFDYIGVLKTIIRISHHSSRVVTYVSHGRKVDNPDPNVNQKLLNEIKEGVKAV